MPHEESRCKNIKDHCLFHGEDEPVTVSTYKVCYTCFHVFKTAEDLKNLASENEPPQGTVFKTAHITECPLCRHPFDKDRHMLTSDGPEFIYQAGDI